MSSLLRPLSAAVLSASRTRSFTASAPFGKDLVQDVYLREIRAYKAPPAAKDAHVGVVKKYSPPAIPKAPVLPADLAGELAAYDAVEPSRAVENKVAMDSGEDAEGGAEEFLSFLEQDLPKPEHAHH